MPYREQESFEGTVTNPETLNLSRNTGQITLTNDHETEIFCYKFDLNEQYATLKPNESITLDFQTIVIHIHGLGFSIPYRIWCYA